MKIPIRVDTALYYPAHIYKIEEFKALAVCFDEMIQPLWRAMEQVYSDQYLDELDEVGCRLHEEFLGIKSRPGDGLLDRRRRIKGYHTSGLPYTENKLNEVLTAMCGAGGYDIAIDKGKKTIEVSVRQNPISLTDYVREILREFLPADMASKVLWISERSGLADIYIGGTRTEHIKIKADPGPARYKITRDVRSDIGVGTLEHIRAAYQPRRG